MGSDEVGADFRQVLRYWWMLELFGPQKVPKLTRRSAGPADKHVVEWRPGEPLPWNVLRPPEPFNNTPRRWQHTVYLGVYDLEDTYQQLHRVFGEDRDAYDERRTGDSACAGIVLDDRGALVVDSAVLSSALWAVAQLRGTASAHDLRWAKDFSAAASRFVEEVDAFASKRRDAVDAEVEPAHDGKSLRNLLRISHEAAGVTGIRQLAGERIIIRSVAVSASRGHEATVNNDFVNSFFLEDLTAVQEGLERAACPAALSAYLTSDASIRPETRIDVMTNDAAVNAGVVVERLPRGRWPSNPEHGLALRQQFAVNQALNDLTATRELMGVNGPPGTGKTTMLRDVLAGNVVERARRLASLEHFDKAFTSTTHKWTAGDGHPREVRQLREDLTGFEMVVASANNAAVENVSTEIPAREAIAENWRGQADYSSDKTKSHSRRYGNELLWMKFSNAVRVSSKCAR